jgi:hypothetical protein
MQKARGNHCIKKILTDIPSISSSWELLQTNLNDWKQWERKSSKGLQVHNESSLMSCTCALWRYGPWRTLTSLKTDFHSSLLPSPATNSHLSKSLMSTLHQILPKWPNKGLYWTGIQRTQRQVQSTIAVEHLEGKDNIKMNLKIIVRMRIGLKWIRIGSMDGIL